MVKRILVDGLSPENVQVAVVRDDVLEAIEYSSASKKSIKGNIYLAQITRIEPALQAAFIDYGDVKNGFISFSEIHPNYYNIPVKDRRSELRERGHDRDVVEEGEPVETNLISPEANEGELAESGELALGDQVTSEQSGDDGDDGGHCHAAPGSVDVVEADGDDGEDMGDTDEGAFEKEKQRNARRYKIQEVLKRNQILLVQVVKEIRGNKGASFTSYISLAGRYCVLMPNCNSSGGISRKITGSVDRKELQEAFKEIAEKNDNPAMGFIIRTSGQGRTKEEIKSDYDCLVKVWNEVRTKTLLANAPAFIYADGNILKKIVMDYYSASTKEIVVQGNEVFDSLNKMVEEMSLGDRIKIRSFNEPVPIFSKFQIDDQVAALYDPLVRLRSGASLVINKTEALTAIDVNSGRSTSERNVEETAYKTNVEAAKEIARQIHLLDISGLIVIDFIDMEEGRNRKQVEKVFRDSLRYDKAKVQLGRISNFGLMEMTRQRLAPSFLEANSEPCKHCLGRGIVKSGATNAASIFKMTECEIAQNKNIRAITISLAPDMVLYMLNNKRDGIRALENKYAVAISFAHEDGMKSDGFALEVTEEGPLPQEQLHVHILAASEVRQSGLEREEAAKVSACLRQEGRGVASDLEVASESVKFKQVSSASGGREMSGRSRSRRRFKKGKSSADDQGGSADSAESVSVPAPALAPEPHSKQPQKPKVQPASQPQSKTRTRPQSKPHAHAAASAKAGDSVKVDKAKLDEVAKVKRTARVRVEKVRVAHE